MLVDSRDAADCRSFVKAFGAELGLEWDDSNDRLQLGPRGRNGESIGKRENQSNFFRQGQSVGQPLALDSYLNFELFEKVFRPRPMARPAWPVDSDRAKSSMSRRLSVTLASLPNRDRRLLEMRFLTQLTLDEIGDELGITYQAVQARLRNVLRRLATYGALAASDAGGSGRGSTSSGIEDVAA